MNAIQRICELKLNNFKGFVGDHCLNTDADIVLITGPNGYGKTSLLEALTVILTGHHNYGTDPVSALVPVLVRKEGSACECQIEINAEIFSKSDGSARKGPLRIGWDENGNIREPQKNGVEDPANICNWFPRPTEYPPSPLLNNPDRYELHARLCSFSQERVTFQYDQSVRGETLRDMIEPVSPEIRKALKMLSHFQEEISERVEELRHSPPEGTYEAILEALEKKSLSFMQFYNHMAQWLEKDWPPIPEPFKNGGAASLFFRPVLERRGKGALQYNRLAQELEDELKSDLSIRVNEAMKRAVGLTEEGVFLQKRLDECEKKIQEIEKIYPNLEQEISIFEPRGKAGCDALIILRTLAANASRWAKLRLPTEKEQAQGRLQRVLKEFGRVDENSVAECRDILENWLGKRKERWNRLGSLQEKKKNLQDKLVLYQSSEEVRKSKESENRLNQHLEGFTAAWKAACQHEEGQRLQDERNRAADSLEYHQKAIEVLLNSLKVETNISPDLAEKLCKIIQGVVKRFSLVEGLLPLTLKPEEGENVSGTSRSSSNKKRLTHRIMAADGREMTHFSTGQKGQFAISILAAQNLYLSYFLPQRIILLDDVTTAYDLSNLTREAILWRQLAYGQKRGDLKARQVFISSHHGDMTNHLIELLAPPAGRSLRLLRFTGWSEEKGPEIDTFEVETTAESSRSEREDLAADLRDFYHEEI